MCPYCQQNFVDGQIGVKCKNESCDMQLCEECHARAIELTEKPTCPSCRRRLGRHAPRITNRIAPGEVEAADAAAAEVEKAAINAARASKGSGAEGRTEWEKFTSKQADKNTRPEDRDPDGPVAKAKREHEARMKEEEATKRLIKKLLAGDGSASSGSGSASRSSSAAANSSSSSSAATSSAAAADSEAEARRLQQVALFAQIKKQREQERADADMARELAESLKRPHGGGGGGAAAAAGGAGGGAARGDAPLGAAAACGGSASAPASKRRKLPGWMKEDSAQ